MVLGTTFSSFRILFYHQCCSYSRNTVRTFTLIHTRYGVTITSSWSLPVLKQRRYAPFGTFSLSLKSCSRFLVSFLHKVVLRKYWIIFYLNITSIYIFQLRCTWCDFFKSSRCPRSSFKTFDDNQNASWTGLMPLHSCYPAYCPRNSRSGTALLTAALESIQYNLFVEYRSPIAPNTLVRFFKSKLPQSLS